MGSSEDVALPSRQIPPAIEAVFQTREWLDFVKSAPSTAEIVNSATEEKPEIKSGLSK
jgi:hypothetical protein